MVLGLREQFLDMETKSASWAVVNQDGNLVLPPEIAAQYGLRPGARVRLEQHARDLRLQPPVTHLRKIYIEPTDLCNLDCRFCMRHSWKEQPGRMSDETFSRILEDLEKLSPKPTVFFGGIGEPLFHPKTTSWVKQIKELGARVELITNGTLLTERKGKQLIDAGLDVLWVSIDGASPESYADVRLGAELPKVIGNLSRFHKMRPPDHYPVPDIGIAFVAMKRNIHDLPAVIALGRKLGARLFFVSNVFPYTRELQDEMLYARTLKDVTYMSSSMLPHLTMPKMDLNDHTRNAFWEALSSGCSVTFAGHDLVDASDVCSFIQSGSLTIGWQGDIAPCQPLLHTYISYLSGRERINHRHIFGNIHDQPLMDIWLDQPYVEFRERVQSFAFAPCTFCGGCELIEENQEDCFLNPPPVCGGCLWSQGIIQCP